MAKLQYNLDEIKSAFVEPGKHRARVKSIANGLSKKNKPMLTWTWRIISGSEKGKEIRSWTSLEPQALSNLKMHLEGLGLHGKISLDTTRLIGKTALLVCAQTPGVSRTGEEGLFTNVVAVRPDPKAEPVEEEEMDEEEDEDEDEDLDGDEDEEEDEEEEEPARPTMKKVSKFRATPSSNGTNGSKPLKKKKPVRHYEEDDIPF